jgi:hypothetical protein
MNRLSGLDLLFIVAAKAERLRRRGREFHPSNIPSDSNFMAAQAAGGDCRVDCLPFALVFVTLEALCRVDVLIERYRVRLRKGRQNRNRGDVTQDCNCFGEDSPGYIRATSVLSDHANLSFCTTLSVIEPIGAVAVENCKYLQHKGFLDVPTVVAFFHRALFLRKLGLFPQSHW